MHAGKILIVFLVGYIASLQAESLTERSNNSHTDHNPNPCQHGGTYTRLKTSKSSSEESKTPRGPKFTCTCPEGFYGIVCQFHVCKKHDCQKGTCEADKTSVRGYKCNCDEGYKGENCDVQVCEKHDCQKGTCEADKTNVRGYKCNCMEDYKGKNCEVHVCDQHVCQKGTCEADKTSARGYKCNCDEGYKGENCDVHVCDQHDCMNGTCEADKTSARGYKCNCMEGYEGENCEVRSCTHPWIKHDNYCFFFSDNQVSWTKASEICRSFDSFLAEPITQDINSFIVSKISVTNPNLIKVYWLGGSDMKEEGKFVWPSQGKPFSFTFWIPGDPNNGNGEGEEDCVLANWNGDGRWADYFCDRQLYYICQK
ncbi:adhesive plaque matrix protein 2-like, partial [Saccostrea cucullata]|uniref:adhesive plaque matrix protein 2-like n=1 Tax=Saccostrea cuccullata TaxID=36930 RepID=UPI002ED36A13